MALNDVLAEIWSGMLVNELRQKLRWRRAVEDYSDEVPYGRDLHINEISNAGAIANYTKNTNIADPTIANDEDHELDLNQRKYFNIAVDDIDKVQARPNIMRKFLSKSAFELAKVVDDYIYDQAMASLPDSSKLKIAAGKIIKKDGSTTTANIKSFLLNINDVAKTLLDKDWPIIVGDAGGETGEGDGSSEVYGFVSTKVYHALNEYFATASDAGADVGAVTMLNGRISRLFGLPIIPDRRLSNEDTAGLPLAVFGMRSGMAFALQIEQFEAYRMEKRFSDAIKGLYVYGAERIDDAKIYAITQVS